MSKIPDPLPEWERELLEQQAARKASATPPDTQPAGTPAADARVASVQRAAAYHDAAAEIGDQYPVAAARLRRLAYGILHGTRTPEPSTPPAQQPHTAPAAAGPPPGTVDGPGVLGRALLDEDGGLWPLVGEEDAHRCGVVTPSIRHRFEADRGRCREVLLADPAEWNRRERLADAAWQWRDIPPVGDEELMAEREALTADLIGAVDALDRPTTGGPELCGATLKYWGGGAPAVCTVPAGHAGVHHDNDRNISWPTAAEPAPEPTWNPDPDLEHDPGPPDPSAFGEPVEVPPAPGPAGDLYEQLAAIEHQRWADWQRYMHSLCERRDDGALVIPADRVTHWERQIDTPYAELSDAEKAMDREQVGRYWRLVRPSAPEPAGDADDCLRTAAEVRARSAVFACDWCGYPASTHPGDPPEPAGDGPGWDRFSIHAAQDALRHGGKQPDLADRVGALLAHHDLRGRMLRRATADRDRWKRQHDFRYAELEQRYADLAAARAELATARRDGSTDTLAWVLYGDNVCDNCKPRIETMRAQVVAGSVSGSPQPAPAGGEED